MKLTLPGQASVEIKKEDYEFLQKISDSDFVGLMGGDWIKYWRWHNLIRIAEMVRVKCKQLDIEPKQIAPKFIREFFENASLEENSDIQNMWANLLTCQMSDRKVNIYYLNILKELEPTEARLLNALHTEVGNSTTTMFDLRKVLSTLDNISEVELRIMIHKLYSFNILRPPLMTGIGFFDGQNSNDGYAPALETIDSFRFSEMGIDFCETCSGIKK